MYLNGYLEEIHWGLSRQHAVFPRSALPDMLDVHDNVCKAGCERNVARCRYGFQCHLVFIHPRAYKHSFICDKEEPR
ncbi:predicted protein [Botrytis cinerea T4]|uniref:Uncharacterized protein n=1 Tax=Botryotinia fuckeliana (strain T4) TaxID=999810 RepID=G2XS29_BOTF4|nr:predicted protein [Botrytis cinerea T4]